MCTATHLANKTSTKILDVYVCNVYIYLFNFNSRVRKTIIYTSSGRKLGIPLAIWVDEFVLAPGGLEI